MDSYIKMYRKSKDINEDYRHLYGINLLDQEQLQKILNETVKNDWHLTYWKNEDKEIYVLSCKDISYTNKEVKVVFLQMIMEKKYGKSWTGKDWEAIK